MMELSEEHQEYILDCVMEVLSNPNIVGIYVGKKSVNQKMTQRTAVVFHVIEKKEEPDLGIGDIHIPKYMRFSLLDDIESKPLVLSTDVVEVGEIQEGQGPVAPPSGLFPGLQRPCPGGVTIGASGVSGLGTLGVSIEFQGSYRLLSNNHVISDNGKGSHVHQPPLYKPASRLEQVTGYYEQIVYYPFKNTRRPKLNNYDLAWCDTTEEQCSRQIVGIGIPTGFRKPKVGEPIMMGGAGNGRAKSARIISLRYRYRSFSSGRLEYSWWRSGILLSKNISGSGYSGAVYVSKKDLKIVGIHRANSNRLSVGARIPSF